MRLGLVGDDPRDFNMIFDSAEEPLRHEQKYKFCPNGYVVDRNRLPIYHKLVYVELLVKCKMNR